MNKQLTDDEFAEKFGFKGKARHTFNAYPSGPPLEMRMLNHLTFLVSPRYTPHGEDKSMGLARSLAEESSFKVPDVAAVQVKFTKLSHETGFIDRAKFAKLLSKQKVTRRDVADGLFAEFGDPGRSRGLENGVMSFQGLIQSLATLQGGDATRELHSRAIFRLTADLMVLCVRCVGLQVDGHGSGREGAINGLPQVLCGLWA